MISHDRSLGGWILRLTWKTSDSENFIQQRDANGNRVDVLIRAWREQRRLPRCSQTGDSIGSVCGVGRRSTNLTRKCEVAAKKGKARSRPVRGETALPYQRGLAISRISWKSLLPTLLLSSLISFLLPRPNSLPRNKLAEIREPLGEQIEIAVLDLHKGTRVHTTRETWIEKLYAYLCC